MVSPVDPSAPRPIPPPGAEPSKPAGASARTSKASSSAAGSPSDVLAPGLLGQIPEAGPGFDPFAVAERAGLALAGSALSIGNAQPEAVARLQG